MTQANYVLDANVFIEAARRYYAFDLVPRFWECLKEQADTGRIQSIDRVKDELARGKDQLADWASKDFVDAFASTNEPEVITAFGEIMVWVQSQEQFTDAAKAQCAQCADGWLVAYARVHGLTVVTHEVFSAGAKNRVKIPNICSAFEVLPVDTFAMLRGLGARLG
jgi:predicted nucleic acid-binding protein